MSASAALFFLGVPDADQVKPKALGALRRAILGAIASTDANRALVCGLPNVGALATRLPRARVERVRACVSACECVLLCVSVRACADVRG